MMESSDEGKTIKTSEENPESRPRGVSPSTQNVSEELSVTNSEMFFFVMTSEEKQDFLQKVDRYVHERRHHEALSKY